MKIIYKTTFTSILMATTMPYFIFAQNNDHLRFWPITSVDTMKYSRDLAREKLNDRSFDKTIGAQIKAIADTGATHVIVATPYDNEFLPFLKKWVSTARKHDLKVWFRGNFSGWEKWFDYSKISRDEHAKKTEQFILNNKDIFEDGDIFTACPECENGGPGDPRFNGDKTGHREFLIKEHKIMANAFKKIGRDIIYNYNSMNGDVAFLIMNKETTQALGGIITIDHYVKSKERLISDIKKLSHQGGDAKIVLGEIGVPIPDIHGNMSAIDQAKWMQDVFAEMAKMPEIEAVNYWTGFSSSTQLWDTNLKPRPIVDVIKNFYQPALIHGFVKDQLDHPVKEAAISNEYGSTVTSNDGSFELPYISYLNTKLKIEGNDFNTKEITIESYDSQPLKIVLERSRENFTFKLRKLLRQMAVLLTSLFQ